jgi:hypothetical protein
VDRDLRHTILRPESRIFSHARQLLDFYVYGGCCMVNGLLSRQYPLSITISLRYYSDVDTTHGVAEISVDGRPPDKVSGFSAVGQLSRQLLWSMTDLAPGAHTLTLTHADEAGRLVTLDFFRCIAYLAPFINIRLLRHGWPVRIMLTSVHQGPPKRRR